MNKQPTKVTIEDIAHLAGVSTATVSRYLSGSSKVARRTGEKIEAAVQNLGYIPGQKVSSGNTTMDEVAQRANVSKATVSRVINNSNLVQPKTRQQVLQAMEELNYQPNMIARQLRKQETKLIGIVLPDISNPFYAKVLKGIEEIVCKLDYDVVLMNTNYNEEREAKSFQTLMERRAQGFCFMCHHLDQGKVDYLQSLGLPYVMISRTVDHPDVPYVNIDNRQGGYDATRHLISLGHRRIGIIAGPADDECSSLDRIAGYRRALAEAGIEYDPALHREGDFTYATARGLAQELLTLAEPPTALFAVSDETAIGAISGALELGFKVPDDLSVIGFDNLEMAKFYNPPLSTIAQPMSEMGRKAAQILLGIIEGTLETHHQVILPHQLVERRSTIKFTG